MVDYNARFAKCPRSSFNAHRPLRGDEDLELIFTWRVQRKVSQSLTLQHDRVIYLLADTPENRALVHRYIDVYEYPDDGRIEVRADGRVIPYERYNRLPEVDIAAVVDNKRLGHALETALLIQAQRDNRHRSNTPSRANTGQAAHPRKQTPGTKRSRQFTAQDIEAAVLATAER